MMASAAEAAELDVVDAAQDEVENGAGEQRQQHR